MPSTATRDLVRVDARRIPTSEPGLLSLLFSREYPERVSLAQKLAHANRDDPRLLGLVQELLRTELLPEDVPLVQLSPLVAPDQPPVDVSPTVKTIKLTYRQSTTSQRFFQREVGIAMAVAAQMKSVLLHELPHPSMTGKKRIVDALAKTASNEVLTSAYLRCVPAVQDLLGAALLGFGRQDVLAELRLASTKHSELPLLAALRSELATCNQQDRKFLWEMAWNDYLKLGHKLRCIEKDQLLVLPGENFHDVLLDLLEKNLPVAHPPERNAEVFFTLPSFGGTAFWVPSSGIMHRGLFPWFRRRASFPAPSVRSRELGATLHFQMGFSKGKEQRIYGVVDKIKTHYYSLCLK
ncbi:hypothetical protein DFJ77DRAFT_116334 [Powellomyces hirtus]|nr:hypothetical protein DFJ77DRAFT_116334 [Powellomyces hirtus]